MEERNHSNLDDLISSGGGQPIIVQEGSSDKKFLYTLLILLVVLFIIAMAVIAYLGSKYFGSNTPQVANNATTTQQVVAKPKTQKQVEVAPKAVEVANEQKSDNDTLSELENLVKEQENKKEEKVAKATSAPQVKKQEVVQEEPSKEEQTIAKVAQSATGGKTLSQEDLAKIAKLVAQELAKNKTSAPKQSASRASSDKDLVASLEGAQTDTLKNESIDTTNLKGDNVNASNTKKVDTFNKVVISNQNAGDDELAKLSSEIDTILQSEEVTKEEKNLKYGKELQQEITRREGELRFIVVKKGDTLSSLAYKAYGRASAYTKIYEANPDLVKNPNRIYIGMKLRVPVDEEYIKNNKENR